MGVEVQGRVRAKAVDTLGPYLVIVPYLGKEVADARRSYADKHLHEIRARDGEKGHARLASCCLHQERGG